MVNREKEKAYYTAQGGTILSPGPASIMAGTTHKTYLEMGFLIYNVAQGAREEVRGSI